MMSSGENLISVQIKRRSVTYYLTTEEDLEYVRSNSLLGDIFFALGSLTAGGFISVHLTRVTGIQLPQQTNDLLDILFWVFLAATVILGGFAAYFHYRSFTTIKKIQGSGIVKSLDGSSTGDPGKTASDPQSTTAKVSRLEILKAEYWTPRVRLDVTEELKGKIVDNKLDAYASNSLKRDPEEFVPKKMTVQYRYAGITVTKEYKEDERILIP